MTAALTPAPKAQFLASDGTPLVGGKLYSYAAGTTTPLATYTTYAGNVANTNPVILDSRGEANVWLGAAAPYKLALYTATDTLIWTVDNVYSANSGIFDGPVSGTTATFSGALTALSGAFSGPVSGTTGTFSGAVSGTTGTFSGAVSGTTGTFSGNVQMASANGGQLAGLRNKIINGDFRVAQRGTSITASAGVATYTLDRWKVSATGAAVTVTRGSASTAYSNLANYLTVTGAAGNTLVNAQQYIESANSRDLAGQTVTLSYWVYNNTGSSFTATSGFYYPTVTDTFTSVTTIAATAGGTVCPNATWTQVTVSQAIPAAATTGLQIVLGANNQAVLAGQSISFGNAQLEVGPVATPFEQRPIGMELALCQRYFEVLPQAGTGSIQSSFATGVCTAATTGAVPIIFKVPKRATPSATSSGSLRIYSSAGGDVAITVLSFIGGGPESITGTFTVASGLTAGHAAVMGRVTNTTGEIQINAEL